MIKETAQLATILVALSGAACASQKQERFHSASAGSCNIYYPELNGIDLISAGVDPNWDAAQGGAEYGFSFSVNGTHDLKPRQGSFYISCHPNRLEFLVDQLFEERNGRLVINAGAHGEFEVKEFNAKHWRGFIVDHQMSGGPCELIAGPIGEEASFEVNVCSIEDDSFLLRSKIKEFVSEILGHTS
ncbi:MAG: hypothetical protein ACTHZI_07680 [Luteimonas sp.]